MLARQDALKIAHITTSNGLSINTVRTILQDDEGFMWFGTSDGLNKFDGYKFTVYKNDHLDSTSLSDNWIWTLYKDRSGTLWIGTKGGGLNSFDKRKEGFTRYQHKEGNPNSLSDDRIKAIYEDRTGTLWVGTGGGGLNRFDPKTGMFSRFKHDENNPNSLSHDNVAAIIEDETGTLWIGTNDGLNEFDRKGETFKHWFKEPDNPASLSDNEVTTIYEDRSGVLWVGTFDGGLNRFNREDGTFTRYQHAPHQPNHLSDNTVTVIYEDSEGTLWVGTNGGLNTFDSASGTFERLTPDKGNLNSLGNKRVQALYEDNSGVLWVGTDGGGASKLTRKRKAFAHWEEEPGNPNSLRGSIVLAICEDKFGAVWIGTDGEGLNRLDRMTGAFTHYSHDGDDPTSLSHNSVLTILKDKSGVLWIGTRGGGLSRFDRNDNTFIHYQHDPDNPNSLRHNIVRTIYEDRSGRLWIGTKKGLHEFDRKSKTFTRYRKEADNPNSLSHDNIRVIFEDKNGILWIGTDGGLNRFDRDKGVFVHYVKEPDDPSSLSYDQVRSIHEDKSGTLWIGTRGGLNRFDREKAEFIHYTEEDGLSNNVVFGILEDSNGNLWLSTAKGLSRFNPRNETFKTYDTNSGLVSDQFESGAHFQNRSGEMFFGGINGFTAFFPDSIKENQYVPPIVITSFKKLNKKVRLPQDLSDGIELSYRDYVFSFEFAALDYTLPEKNEFVYMMEGFDEEWIYSGSENDATYTNLDPGSYRFRVKGSNSDGTWNEQGTSVRITITPPFWHTWWFRISAGIVLTGLVLTIYRVRTHTIRERNRYLEERVNSRTAALRQEINERERTEEELRKSEEKYRYLVENVNDVIFSLVEDGVVQYISPAIETILGYTSDEILNSHIYDLVFEEDRKPMKQNLQKILDGESVTSECRMIKKSGEICWMRISEKPTRQGDKVVGSQGVLTNITDRKVLESQLVQSQKLESIGQLAAGIAHEINTPIQYIGDNTRFLEDAFTDFGKVFRKVEQILKGTKYGSDDQIFKEVETVRKDVDLDYLLEEAPIAIEQSLHGVERVANIVRAMKGFSHPGTEERNLTDLNKALENTITVTRSEWKYVAEMMTDFDQHLPLVPCLPGEINQVFLNIIVNAAHAIAGVVGEHSGKKGTITIGTSHQDGWAEIRISDTGPGIPEEARGKIFDPFFTTKEVGKGSGQGLAISHNIVVKKLSGSITFETEMGHGTTFIVRLPVEN